MTLVEKVQAVADLAGSEETETQFLREFGALWVEMKGAVELMRRLGEMHCAWKAGKDKSPKAMWN